jgi:xanthine/uracil permease
VGVISGLMGLGLVRMGFIYASGWNPTTHSILGGIVILSPYGLALFYWLITKFQETDRQWFDEKQSQDIGKSALLTLAVITILMILLFAVNFRQLNGIISMLWLPIYLFSTLLLFSLGNIYFSKKM